MQLTRLPDRASGPAEAQGAKFISLVAAESEPAWPFPFPSLPRCCKASAESGMLNMETCPFPCAAARSPSLQPKQPSASLYVSIAST